MSLSSLYLLQHALSWFEFLQALKLIVSFFLAITAELLGRQGQCAAHTMHCAQLLFLVFHWDTLTPAIAQPQGPAPSGQPELSHG